MKLQFLSKSLFAALLALFATASLYAQTEPAPTPDKNAKVGRAERHGKHSDQLAKELNLSEEQKSKFKKIDEEHAAKSKASRTAKKEEMAKMREERIKAHKSVLTPEQAAKYDEVMAKKKAKKGERKEKKAGYKADKKEKKAEKKAIKEELRKQ